MDNMDNAINPDKLHLIKKHCKGSVAVDVVYDTEWNEYQARVWKNGKLNHDATYYTNDRADAIGTARLIFRALAATMDDNTN